MNKEDVIYIAGLFDGDGCITIRMNRPTSTSKHKSTLFSLVVKVTMCDKKTIKYLHDAFKVGHFRKNTGKEYNKSRSDAWSWTVMSRNALFVIKKLYPYLRTKKSEADVALEFEQVMNGRSGRARTNIELTNKRRLLYERLRELKPSNKWRGGTNTL